MVKDMWVTHGMRRAMCQSIKREMRVSGRGEEISPAGLGGGEKHKEEKRERKEKKKRKGRNEDPTAFSFDFRHSDGRGDVVVGLM